MNPNEIKNVFIHDQANVLKRMTANEANKNTSTIVAKEGFVKEKKMALFNGSILTTDKNTLETDIVKFQQLNIDLKEISTEYLNERILSSYSATTRSRYL